MPMLPTPHDPALFAKLEADLIFPEQFFHKQEPDWSGERALLWAVFTDGIEIFHKAVTHGVENTEAFVETLAWINERGSDSIFSFDSLCEIFGHDPAWSRRALLEWRTRQHEARTLPVGLPAPMPDAARHHESQPDLRAA